LGVLHVGTLTPRVFSPRDSELLQLVADRVAVAIERAYLHEETVQLDRLKANFVAIASHELRTPATTVYGVLTTLELRFDDLEPGLRNELIRTGVAQGERLKRLLEELLDLSRLDARMLKVDPKPLALASVLREIISSLPPGTPVELDVLDSLAIVADPVVLDRVVSNLLLNAVRYGAPPILVSAEAREMHVRIAVQDSGTGVSEDLLPHLFDRFARGEVAGAGSGLGLAIARTYARAHGGDLIYEPDGVGARFELILPRD
jgi:two-component system sensor histidine kinase MtrB